MQAPSKEEILKKIEDPNTVTEVVNKFFGELDKANTGFITKEDYLKKSEEFAKEKAAGLPHHKPPTEQKAKLIKFVDENTVDVKISKEALTKILTGVFKGIAEHIKQNP